MDYVQEELLRQQMLLSFLLGAGHGTEEPAESGPDRSPDAERTWPAESSGTEASAERTDEIRQEAAAPQIRISRSSRKETGPQTDPARTSEALLPETQTAVRLRTAESDSRSGSAHFGLQDSADWIWAPAVGRTAGGSAAPLEVSRAIQRDARRYDGGFSIY